MCGLAQQADAIDKDAMGPHFDRRLQQQAIGRTQSLIEHLRAGEDDLKLFVRLQFRTVPAQRGRVTNEFIRTDLKYDDDAGLVELSDPPVNELYAEEGLAASRRSFDDNHIGLRNPT